MRYRKISLHDPALAADAEGGPRAATEAPLFPPTTLRVPPISFGDLVPDGLGIADEAGLAAWHTAAVEIGGVAIHRLRDALVHAPYGIVTLDGLVLTETLGHIPFHLPGYLDDGDAVELPEPATVVEMPAAAHGASGNYANYFHWMLDALPRLQVEPLAPRPYRGVLLLPPAESGAQADVVRLLSGGPCPLFLLAQGHAARVRSLFLVPNLVGYGFQPNPHLGAFFARLRRLLGAEATPGRRLYAARRDSGNRVMANEAEVEALAGRHGFEPVTLSGLPLAEQARLFAGASHVVAPHGAGLTNLVFCTPGAAVLELHMSAYVNWCFRRLCGVGGLRYGCLVGQTAGDGAWAHAMRWAAPLDRLRAVLEGPAFLGGGQAPAPPAPAVAPASLAWSVLRGTNG